jgi:hypothetical protein
MRYAPCVLLLLSLGCQSASEPAVTKTQRDVQRTPPAAQVPICKNGTFEPIVGQDRRPAAAPADNPESAGWRPVQERPLEWRSTAPAGGVPPIPTRYTAQQQQYLQAWEDAAPSWAGLSEDEREARRIELKQRILGGAQ